MRSHLWSGSTARILLLGITVFGLHNPAVARSPASVAAEIAPLQAQIEDGKKLLDAGQFAAAADLFEQAAARAPFNKKGQKARVWAGIARAWEGRIDQAIQHFDWVASHAAGPELIEEALYEKARGCERAGRQQEALAAVNQLRSTYPASDRLPGAAEIERRIQGAASGADAAEAGPVQAQIDQARTLFDAGKFTEAASLFERAAAAGPMTAKGQKAKIWAGIAHAWAGQIDQAIAYFDFAASRSISSEVSEQALYEKARFCEKAGRMQEALAAIDTLRIAYPESDYLLPALELRGRIQGDTPERIEAVKNREREAAELLLLARDKLTTKTGRAEVLDLVGRIETAFSDTSAAVAVLPVKGEALHIQGRLQEAEAVYRQLFDRVVPLAPRSKLAVQAKLRVPYEMLHRAVQLCEEAIADGASKDPAKVEAAREQCRRVLAMPEYDAKTTARARALLVEIEIFDGKGESAQLMAERFLSKHYNRSTDLHTHGPWVAVLHLCIAQAADLAGDHGRAVQKCQEIKQLLEDVPEAKRAALEHVLERVYLQEVLGMLRGRADRATAIAAARELIRRFPESKSAEIVRRRLSVSLESDGASSAP